MIHFHCEIEESLLFDKTNLPKNALCRIHLGLEKPFFPLDDSMHFQALTLALKQWSKEIFPLLEEPKGILLFVGSADFAASFLWTEQAVHNFAKWRLQRPYLEGMQELYQKRLFCADSFVYYFQMLAHSLPDELPIFLWFDAEGLGTTAERHQILSQERFNHFQVAVKNLSSYNGPSWEGERLFSPENRSTYGLCLPEEALCGKEILEKINRVLESKEPLRVISEPFLTDEWEGIDLFYVLEGTTTLQGERKLKGFLATGGTVTVL